MTGTTLLEKLKEKQQQIWSSGDYAKIAWLTVPLADVLCDAVDLRPGARVLDVATGTGHVALAAARRFCEATGVDYVPSLVSAARRRAQAEGLSVDFQEADAEDMPFADDSFDYVLSAIGVMFTADHQRAADELVRVCAPGGRIGLVSWTPTGFVGDLLGTVGRYAAPPPGAQPPPRWGVADTLRDLFGDRISALESETRAVTERFLSPEQFADFFIAHYGPTHKVAQRLDDADARAFRQDLAALAASASRTDDGTVVCDWEYLVAVATKA
ncbi:class I SAM-dependent methyltransferase [Nocardiopsis sp. NRRL B-16309]|uniref:class I SAM-dependent methyltransferase n=1 Tax=Nocardiopsis sp. NRRL B-16309 TaxID=1519494 RepID=UPI0006ADC6DF|nr:class I SAM-dependent methyltransferase [Nocardiopsis sp. NRRL B-16309]KOX12509.1 SAM-dependent methyltransferase [Nocardiopsis sp. NRRL B-16309]